MGAFQNEFFKNLAAIDTDLRRVLWRISKEGFNIVDIEPVYFLDNINVATDPSFDIFPAISNVLYIVTHVTMAKYSTAGNPAGNPPSIRFFNWLTGLITSYSFPRGIPNNAVTILGGCNEPKYLKYTVCQGLQWSDNNATTGTYSVLIWGYKVTKS